MLPEGIQRLKSIILDLDSISRYIPNQSIKYTPDPGKPAIIRKAEACVSVFNQASINHLPDERFAGNNSVKYAARPDHLTGAEWAEIGDYPAGVSEATLVAMEERMFYLWSFAEGHIVPNKEKVLKQGLLGVIAEIEARLEDPVLTGDQTDFLQSALIECRGALTYAQRHARHFAALSSRAETDEERQYYRELSDLCQKVPAHPAESFREALQSFLFAQFATQVDDVSNHSLGRVDQYLYPYYTHDIERGALTREEAKELLAEFWLKLNLNYKIQEEFGVDYSGHVVDFDTFDPRDGRSWLDLKAIDQIHFDDGQAMDIAGLDENGNDAVNDLSWLILEVQDELRTFEPKTNLKYTAKTDTAFMQKAYEILASGFGMPSIAYDEAAARGLRSYDGLFAEEDIRDNSHIGCVEIGIPFKGYTDPMNAFLNLPKVVLVTLGNGRVDGRQVGLKLDDPADWMGFWDNFRQQLDYTVGLYTKAMNDCTPFYTKYLSRPLTSALIDGCVEKATPVDSGGSRYWVKGMNSTGFGTAVDSLYAVKKLVYEDRRLSLDEFREILARDYGGDEDFRLYIRNRVPKYGNGVPEVDELATALASVWSDSVRSRKTFNGNRYRPGIYSFYQPVITMGQGTGATPDGRNAGMVLSLNSAPSHGSMRNGLSGGLHSVSAIEHSKVDNASAVDVHLEGKAPPEVIGYIVDVLSKKDVTYSQFTVVDRDRLLDAMAHPEKHHDLVVRVTGFSARFVSLPKATQEEIVKRSFWE
jgi:pyruvate-formate lyase